MKTKYSSESDWEEIKYLTGMQKINILVFWSGGVVVVTRSGIRSECEHDYKYPTKSVESH